MPEAIKIAILILSFQGILMSVALSLKKRVFNHNNGFLILFVFVFSAYLLEQNLYWGPFYLNYPHLFFLTVTFPLLFGPLLYLYIRGVEFRRIHLYHFLPFMFFVIFVIPLYASTAAEKQEFIKSKIMSGENVVSWEFLLFRITTLTQMAVYVVLNQWQLKQKKDQRHYRWLYNINFFFGLFVGNWMLQFGSIIFFRFKFILIVDAVFMGVMGAFILYFFVRILGAPELFKSGPKYSRHLLAKDHLLKYARRLTSLMNEKQIFLKRDLRLVDLASEMDLTEHQISQVLNESFQKNFFEFVNSYRIERSKLLLRDPSFNHLTIEGIAHEVGFKSKSTFNEAFKRFAGTTPSAFKKGTGSF